MTYAVIRYVRRGGLITSCHNGHGTLRYSNFRAKGNIPGPKDIFPETRRLPRETRRTEKFSNAFRSGDDRRPPFSRPTFRRIRLKTLMVLTHELTLTYLRVPVNAYNYGISHRIRPWPDARQVRCPTACGQCVHFSYFK